MNMKQQYHLLKLSLLVVLLSVVGSLTAGAAKTTIWENKAPNGSSIAAEAISLDLSKQSLVAVIDLSSCNSSVSNENTLSIGNSSSAVGNWNASGYQTIHTYYTSSTKNFQVNYINGANAAVQTNYTLSSTDLTLKLTSDGLYLNGELLSNYSASAMSSLISLTTFYIGSTQGTNRSYATYKEVYIEDNETSGGGTTTDPSTATFVIPSFGSNYYICTASDATKAFTLTGTGINEVVKLSTLTNAEGQQWTVKQGLYSTAYPYHFVSAMNGYAIDMAANNTNLDPLVWTSENDYNGGQANVNQEWNLVEADASRHTYYITMVYNNSINYLTTSSDGSKLARTTSQSEAATFGFISTGTTTDPSQPSTPNHGSFSVSWISNQNKVGDYKEDAHATFMPYASTEAMHNDAEYYAKPWVTPQSSEYLNLNGEWKFKYVAGTTNGPGSSEFYAKDYNDNSWGNIKVPLSWEMANHGNPVYTNVGYPFTNNPPSATEGLTQYGVVDHNATGFYRRTFTLPEGWADKEVFIHFDGVYSAAVVWVNGKYVGYSQGANTDAEFDLTGFVTEGENQLSVRVYRWCDGSYLEGQDMWHLAGIHRDVYLVATPKTFVKDHYITFTNNNTEATSGTLNVALTLSNRESNASQKSVKVVLKDAEGNKVTENSESGISVSARDTAKSTLSLSGLSGLHAWTSENPYLYTVEVSQMDENGNEEMAFSTKYGFRSITKSGNLIYVNGKRVYFKGVNTQDTHPEYGRAIDMETMMKDLVMMKRANVNMVRTSHYPRQPKMYAMMDAIGMYCMDEVDVECHYNQGLASNSSWQTAMNDRTTRMVMRDRNHPSVVFWSLGNESGGGTNFAGTYNICKNLDSRFVHYEGANSGASYSDFGSNMYPTVSDVRGNSNGLNGKPYFICEYAHAMGQAVGNLQEYWDVIEGSNGIIGGCIWDWVDQAIYRPADLVNGIKMKNGFNNWVAGYDYNSTSGINYGFQGNFLDNGLITPDRKWTAKLTEVKKVYQNVSFTGFSGKVLTIHNKNAFTNLNEYVLVWRVLKDGRLAEDGFVNMHSIAAGATGTVNIPYTTSTTDGAEYLLDVELCLKENTMWAEQGYEVAKGQFALTTRSTTMAAHTSAGGSLSVSGSTVSGTTADGKSFSMTFSNGKLTNWTYDGKSMLAAGPDFNSWRDIDNDRNLSLGFTNSTSTSVLSLLNKNGNNATMTMRGGNIYTIEYTIYPDATVDMKVTFNSSSSYRRVGLGMQFASGFEQVEYYARGPWSNYVDRKTGSYLGRYTTTVDDMVEENIHPQTYGDHQDLRELTLTNNNGLSLQVQTAGQVAFSLSHFNEQDYCGTGDTMWSDGKHWYDLTKHSQVYAHFDYWQRGLGNNSCGGDGCLSQYVCPTGSYTYTLRFTPRVK